MTGVVTLPTHYVAKQQWAPCYRHGRQEWGNKAGEMVTTTGDGVSGMITTTEACAA